MTVHLSSILESELRRIAGATGKNVDLLVEEAVRQYLDASAISDLDPAAIAAAQETLSAELTDTPSWSNAPEQDSDEAS